jgi:hypothetical protein
LPGSDYRATGKLTNIGEALVSDQHGEQRSRTNTARRQRRRTLCHLDQGISPSLGSSASEVSDTDVFTMNCFGLCPFLLEHLRFDPFELVKKDLTGYRIKQRPYINTALETTDSTATALFDELGSGFGTTGLIGVLTPIAHSSRRTQEIELGDSGQQQLFVSQKQLRDLR